MFFIISSTPVLTSSIDIVIILSVEWFDIWFLLLINFDFRENSETNHIKNGVGIGAGNFSCAQQSIILVANTIPTLSYTHKQFVNAVRLHDIIRPKVMIRKRSSLTDYVFTSRSVYILVMTSPSIVRCIVGHCFVTRAREKWYHTH